MLVSETADSAVAHPVEPSNAILQSGAMAQEHSQKRITEVRFQQTARMASAGRDADSAVSKSDRFGALVVEPMQRAARDLTRRISESLRWFDDAPAKLEILASHGHAPEFWAAVLEALGPTGLSRLVKGLDARDQHVLPSSGVQLRDAYAQGIAVAFDEATLPRKLRETFLDVTPWRDVYDLVERAGVGGQLAGLLAAHLVELGQARADGRNPSAKPLDYGQAMRRLRDLLRSDHAARRAFATHPRTFSRPVQHIVNGADDWVVPMVERELRRLPSNDRLRFREDLIIRIGGQGWVHADFRLLLLHLIAEEETLALLALATHGQRAGKLSTDLDQGTARDFVEVVMTDADDGVEVEAAFWNYAQEIIEREARQPDGGHLEVAAGAAAALLALIDEVRAQMAPDDDAQCHAAMAARHAVAEFIFVNARLLEASSKKILAPGGLLIGKFVLREFSDFPTIDLRASGFDRWVAGRTPRRLLQDLLLLAIQAHGEQNGISPPRDQQRQGDPPLAWLDQASLDPAYHRLISATEIAS